MRHSWRLDAKWVVAIAFVLCAAAASVTYSLYRITAHEPASVTAASVIKGLTEGALDDDRFAQLQEVARASPEAEVQADGLTLPLRGEEIAGLSKEELLEKAAVRLADIIYYEGVDAGQAYFQDLAPNEGEPPSADQAPTANEDEGLSLEPLGLFTQGTHDRLRPFALGLPLGAGALLAMLVLLSRGFGRLGSPGLALVVAVGPAALTFLVLKSVFGDIRDDEGKMFPGAAKALYPTVDDLSRLFAIVVAIGAALVVGAVVGNIALALGRRLRRTTAAAGGEPDEPLDYAIDEGSSPRGGEIPSAGPSGLPQA